MTAPLPQQPFAEAPPPVPWEAAAPTAEFDPSALPSLNIPNPNQPTAPQSYIDEEAKAAELVVQLRANHESGVRLRQSQGENGLLAARRRQAEEYLAASDERSQLLGAKMMAALDTQVQRASANVNTTHTALAAEIKQLFDNSVDRVGLVNQFQESFATSAHALQHAHGRAGSATALHDQRRDRTGDPDADPVHHLEDRRNGATVAVNLARRVAASHQLHPNDMPDGTDYEKEEKRRGKVVADVRAQAAKALALQQDAYSSMYVGQRLSELTQGWPDLLRATLQESITAHQEALRAIQENLTRASTSLDAWSLGTEDPQRQIAAHAAIQEIYRRIETMSPHDTARGYYLQQVTVLHHRYGERQVFTGQDGVAFTEDRGIIHQTPSGERITYDDGTTAAEVDGQWVRTHANGEKYTRPTVVPTEAPAYFAKRDELSDTEIENEHTTALQTWERTRTPDSEGQAAYAARTWAERTRQNQANAQAEVTRLSNEFQTVGSQLQEAEAKLADAGKQGANVAVGESPADHAAMIQGLRDRIGDLQEQHDRLSAQGEQAVQGLLQANTVANEALYWKLFFGVTRPNEAGLLSRNSPRMMENSSIVVEHTAVNDYPPTRVEVRPDGETYVRTSRQPVQDATGAVVAIEERYNHHTPDGGRVGEATDTIDPQTNARTRKYQARRR